MQKNDRLNYFEDYRNRLISYLENWYKEHGKTSRENHKKNMLYAEIIQIEAHIKELKR